MPEKALKVPTGSQLVEFDRRADDPGAVMQTIGAMQSAISEMSPDDLVIEVDSACENGRSTSRFRLRAYKRPEHGNER